MRCSPRRPCRPDNHRDDREFHAHPDHRRDDHEFSCHHDHRRDDREFHAHHDHRRDDREFYARPGYIRDNRELSVCPDPSKKIAFINRMRLVWSQHVYWTRLLIISIMERLKDEKDTAARLLENPGDLAKIYADYYPPDTAKLIAQLVTEHLQIGAALLTALRDGKTAEADTQNRLWYLNADKMADAFAGINPYYDREKIRKMFYFHLDITKQEAAMRLAGNYPADIAAFGRAEQEMLAMADMFADGIMRQFPDRF